jgi:DNA-binding SARP family transcriptional activator
MSRLEVSFFGPFQAELDGVPLANFRSVNTQGLFAYLILQAERPFPRDLLATLFWPDVPDSTAKKNLRQTLYQLRQLLNDSDDLPRPFLLVSRPNIQWHPESDYRLDVQSFLAELARGDLAPAWNLKAGCGRSENGCTGWPSPPWMTLPNGRSPRRILWRRKSPPAASWPWNRGVNRPIAS